MRKRLMVKHAASLTMIGVVILALWSVAGHQEALHQLIKHAGWWGPIVAIGLYGLLSLTPVPSDPLTVIAAMLYGPVWGFVISWMGNNVAALTEYVVAKKVEGALKIDYHQLPAWIKKFPVDSPMFLIGVRFVPAIGGKVVAVMAGMYHVSWWRFIWTTALANIVGSAIWVLGGVGLIKWL